MAIRDEFDEIRGYADPIRRAQRAGELIVAYQQRATELARLRKAAIEEAHSAYGRSYTEIAELLGLTKGRISQIRTSAPPPERAFFGVGPVAIGIPRRFGLEEGRRRPFFDATDQATRDALDRILTRLSLASSTFVVDPDSSDIPAGDVIVVCGPKSAPLAHALLADDEVLAFENTDEGWSISDARTGLRHSSQFQRNSADHRDVGYFSRRVAQDRVVVHIAGITSVGSLGVAHWLDSNVATIYDAGSRFVAGLVECDFDDDYTITGSKLVAGPYPW
ncbi:nitrogenase iron-molybdenum cofactor biosynthesis protein NifE [Nocardia veterana]|uniref:Sigma-70 family RNA polymerase sigma factor n=1 Tax=Nocardia veterana TaxID=132249 RepID=A0A7X6LUV0_9NOCA|nr:nitrogenase iron-molybdenum cofactor biosynthesis protein NifE [Nocardia veterana]NKY84417.1 sigma-70 family RNA polymerase sigma factor [Nocardia veterana]